MYALEFKSAIKGNTLEIPPHLLKRLTGQQQVKVIMLMPETKTPIAQSDQKQALKERLMKISQRCAGLPVLDNRTPDEILGYNETGMPDA